MKQAIVLMATLVHCLVIAQSTKQNAGITETLHDIEIINDTIHIAYGYGTGNIYKTINGGDNWNLISQLDSVYFEQIQFIDECNGWIVGSPNKIYKTKDGGMSWENKSIAQERENKLALIYGMYFSDINHGYISVTNRSESGLVTKIYRTMNGGNTWKEVNEVQEAILNLEENKGHLFGSGAHVIIEDIDDRHHVKYIFKDSTKQVGHIRDIEWKGKGELIGVSDNGYVISERNYNWSMNKITTNRLRRIIKVGDMLLVAGDNNNETGNLFVGSVNGLDWKVRNEYYPDIHRLAIVNKKIWVVGKKGLIQEITLLEFKK